MDKHLWMILHFDILVQQQHSISLPRIVGMLLIVVGVVLIRKYQDG